MVYEEMKMKMIQCLTTLGLNETPDNLEVKESDAIDPDGLNDVMGAGK